MVSFSKARQQIAKSDLSVCGKAVHWKLTVIRLECIVTQSPFHPSCVTIPAASSCAASHADCTTRVKTTGSTGWSCSPRSVTASTCTSPTPWRKNTLSPRSEYRTCTMVSQVSFTDFLVQWIHGKIVSPEHKASILSCQKQNHLHQGNKMQGGGHFFGGEWPRPRSHRLTGSSRTRGKLFVFLLGERHRRHLGTHSFSAGNVDKILLDEDADNDGYLSYTEYASNRRHQIQLQHAARNKLLQDPWHEKTK